MSSSAAMRPLLGDTSSVMVADREASARSFLIVTTEVFSFSVAAVLDTLQEANHKLGQPVFTWQVAQLSSVLSSNISRDPASSSVAATVIFVADDPIMLNLDDIGRERIRRLVRNAARSVASGFAVELFARCGLLEGRTAATTCKSKVTLVERFPHVDFVDAPWHWSGRIASCAGGELTSHVVLDCIGKIETKELLNDTRARLLMSPIMHTTSSPLSVSARYNFRNVKLSRAIQFVTDTIGEEIKNKTIAEEVGLSVRQLERLFSRYVNMSPAQFLMKARLERARELLSGTEMTVIEVACAVGFKNPTHFGRCFRRVFGITPRQVRPNGDPDDAR